MEACYLSSAVCIYINNQGKLPYKRNCHFIWTVEHVLNCLNTITWMISGVVLMGMQFSLLEAEFVLMAIDYQNVVNVENVIEA